MIENIVRNNGFDYVDLYLPSGTLWSIMNIGASSPYGPGLYFQWGDTQGYSVVNQEVGKGKRFNWYDYKFSVYGSSKKFSKYINTCDTLDMRDDAAHCNMRRNWHIPSPKQIQELITNTTSKWIELDEIGVNGRIFISKKDETRYIFIPAAGFAWNDGTLYCNGDSGYIWSSMIDTNYISYSQCFCFDSEGPYQFKTGRNTGLSIRGVIG